MNQTEKENIAKSLSVAFEAMGQTMSADVVSMFITRLSSHQYKSVNKAISRCVAECKYKITLAEIIERIDDGRPSSEKAWQEVQHLTEDDAKVLTVEQNQAFCMVSTSLIDGDTSARIAARQTFLQEYERLCQDSRESGRAVSYHLARANKDHDGVKALEAVTLAITEQKVPQVQAVKLLPQHQRQILELPLLPHEIEHQKMMVGMTSGFSLAEAIAEEL